MKNIKKIEKLMMLDSRLANREYADAFNKMATVMQFIDIKKQTCHEKTLAALYNVTKRVYTYERIARELHTNDNALRKHRNQYVEWFVYFLNGVRTEPLLNILSA